MGRSLIRIWPKCLAGCILLCGVALFGSSNNDLVAQLLELTIPIGTSGAFIPALSEKNGKFYCLTRPVEFSEKLPAAGTVGDVIFANFSQYAIGLRKEITLEKSGHVGFSQDQTYYRAIVRVDGQGTWKSAVTPRKGSNSLSWAVALAARS